MFHSLRGPSHVTLAALGLVMSSAIAGAQAGSLKEATGSPVADQITTVAVDFGRDDYFPLVKERIGLFQENEVLESQAQFNNNLPLLQPLPASSFRLLGRFDDRIAFNTPPQVYAEGGHIHVRPSKYVEDALVYLHSRSILPILSFYGTPKPFGSDNTNLPPDNVEGYAHAMSDLAGRYADGGPLVWEIWNEPNLKVFFRSQDMLRDYLTLFTSTAAVLHSEHPDVLIAGPSFSDEVAPGMYKHFADRYVEAARENPAIHLDYFSFHAYRTPQSTEDMLRSVRGGLEDRFDTVPLMITEYEYYHPSSSFAVKKLREKTEGAVHFLDHIELMMQNTDVATVTWNRFMTNRPPNLRTNPGGLIGYEGDKLAIYNAYELFGWLPVDRNPVTICNDSSIHAMAGSDGHNAGLLIWNSSRASKSIEVRMLHLSQNLLRDGKVQLYRIDADHASAGEGAPADLKAEQVSVGSTDHPLIRVSLPGPGILYLQAADGTGIRLRDRQGLRSAKWIRTWQWCPREKISGSFQSTGDYGTVDPQSWTLRVGTATADGRGIAGVTFDSAPSHVWVNFLSKDFKRLRSRESLAGLRVDYIVGSSAVKSVLLHGRQFTRDRSHELPWGRGASTGDVIHDVGRAIGSGTPFEVNLDRDAPPGWTSGPRRVLVSAWIDSTGAHSQAVVLLSDHREP